jgi:hypothetical protein
MLVDEHEQATLARERENQHALADLRNKLVNAAAERHRLDALVRQRELDHQRIAAELAEERATAGRALEEAARKHADIARALAEAIEELRVGAERAAALARQIAGPDETASREI